MKRIVIALVLIFSLLSAFLLSAPIASALHVPVEGDQLNLGLICTVTGTLVEVDTGFTNPDGSPVLASFFEAEGEFSAGSPFFVRHGWGFGAWTEPPTDDPMVEALNRRASMSDATTFQLFVDGEAVFQTPDFQATSDFDQFLKLFLSEFPDGLTGSHVLTGKWYSDESFVGGTFGVPLLLLQCDLAADFV